jgi:hypothetical protein
MKENDGDSERLLLLALVGMAMVLLAAMVHKWLAS